MDRKLVAPIDQTAVLFEQFLQEQQSTIQRLVDHSEQLSQKIDPHKFQRVVCHADLHAGNVLLEDRGDLYIVDWEDPVLAPKERDLMFIGGGVGNVWNQAREEELFYRGYGQVEIHPNLLAYYRLERILEDIAEYSQMLLFKPVEDKDRQQMYQQFTDMFAPQGVVDIALHTG
jgi:spectinomycin phosphotransferase